MWNYCYHLLTRLIFFVKHFCNKINVPLISHWIFLTKIFFSYHQKKSFFPSKCKKSNKKLFMPQFNNRYQPKQKQHVNWKHSKPGDSTRGMLRILGTDFHFKNEFCSCNGGRVEWCGWFPELTNEKCVSTRANVYRMGGIGYDKNILLFINLFEEFRWLVYAERYASMVILWECCFVVFIISIYLVG